MAPGTLPHARALVDSQDAGALAARVLADAGLSGAAAIPIGRVVEMIAAAAAFGRRYAVATLLRRRACRSCGCTDEDGCPEPHAFGACAWVAEDLCTACAEEAFELTPAGVAALREAPEASAGGA